MNADEHNHLTDDILRVLRATPEAAISAIAKLRIAGPWTEGIGDTWTRHARFDGTSQMQHATGRLAYVVELPAGWFDAAESGPYPSADAARAAADARLVADGWTLEDMTPP